MNRLASQQCVDLCAVLTSSSHCDVLIFPNLSPVTLHMYVRISIILHAHEVQMYLTCVPVKMV